MQKIVLFFIFWGWFGMMGTAQPASPPKKARLAFEQARQAFRGGKTEKAVSLLEKAREAAPGFADVYLLQAGIYQEQGKKEEEILAIEKALALDSLKHHPYYFYILADYYFGQEAYEKAGEYYHLYLQKDSRQRAGKQARKQLENCRFAMEALRTQQKRNVELCWQMEDPVYWPSLDVSGRTLLFTRQSGSRESMWMLKDSVCYPLNFTTAGNAGAPSLTADGQMMYFSMEDGRNGFDMYVSYRLSDTLWSEPVNLGPPVNTEGWEAQPAISADGTRLYFASTREGGQGGSDIWFSRLLRRRPDGRQLWSQPRCLYFNTAGNEMAPFLYFDNRTLFFSSDGYPGMGKKDIYQVDVMEVSPPQHIGITVNTAKDELGFCVDATGKWGYFSSDKSGKRCIYRYLLEDRIACPPAVYVRFRAEDEAGQRIVPDELTVTEVSAGDTLACYGFPAVPEHMLACVPVGRLLLVNGLKKGYLYYSDTLKVDTLPGQKQLEYLVRFRRIADGVSLVLKGVFFDTGSQQLKPESFPELDHLAAFMRRNSEVKIEISGHTDHTGGEEYNRRLSEGRAFEVYRYLFLRRVAKERMTYKGYGKSRPIAPNDTEAGRAMNRRTEIKVEGMNDERKRPELR